MERFVIIDGNAILHRAYHAMPPLTTSSGLLVNAVYGFASILLKVRDNLRPSYFAVTFDLPVPTFRKKMYANYQIKRPEMDKELSGQIEKVKEMVRILGIPIYEKEGYEADDVIGTIAAQAAKIQNPKSKVQTKSKIPNSNEKKITGELETIIVTGDKDILQLVDDTIKVYMPAKGLSDMILYDKEKVKEKLGILPGLVPDYKGLVGDSSDNYPGVVGIGPKTAIDLLLKYGNFKKIYRNLSNIKGTVREKLDNGRKDGEMSYQLAIIIKDVPDINLDIKKCHISDFDNPDVRKFFEEMEFGSLLKRIKNQPFGSTQDRDSKEKSDENKNQMSLF